MQLCPQISVTKQNCEVNLDPTARNLFMAPEWTPPLPKKGALPNASWMASFPFLTSLCVALTPPQLPIPQIAAIPERSPPPST